ncbi:hypothetical protein [Gilliamella apicola]|uniref:hypothetical protein n=1 Tax=Gilliamella apicola TaxID=1196095 RepID=UPI003987C467
MNKHFKNAIERTCIVISEWLTNTGTTSYLCKLLHDEQQQYLNIAKNIRTL